MLTTKMRATVKEKLLFHLHHDRLFHDDADDVAAEKTTLCFWIPRAHLPYRLVLEDRLDHPSWIQQRMPESNYYLTNSTQKKQKPRLKARSCHHQLFAWHPNQFETQDRDDHDVLARDQQSLKMGSVLPLSLSLSLVLHFVQHDAKSLHYQRKERGNKSWLSEKSNWLKRLHNHHLSNDQLKVPCSQNLDREGFDW